MPDEWQRHVTMWNRILRARLGDLQGAASPDRNDEYLFYQLLLGVWPAELTGVTEPDPDAIRVLSERLEAAMLKSVREAKLHSTWASPDPGYEDATLGLVRAALDTSRPNAFLDAFIPFQERIARLGLHNSIVQTALKLTLPGMPDIYQGSELWDLSLVDPDNRRAVDYRQRDRLLQETTAGLESDRYAMVKEMLRDWRDGRVKLAVTATLLAERRAHPSLFALGGYEPLAAVGPKADQICAFARGEADDALVVVAKRFPARIEADPAWGGTVRAMAAHRRCRHALARPADRADDRGRPRGLAHRDAAGHPAGGGAGTRVTSVHAAHVRAVALDRHRASAGADFARRSAARI